MLIEHYKYIKNGKSLSRIMLDRKLKIEIPKFKGIVLNIGSGGIKYTNLNKNAYLITLDADKERSVDIFADARYLPFKNNSIENVLCVAVLEHIYQTQEVINEMYRVMKSKGTLLLWVPFLQQYHAAPNDYHRFTKSGVELMLKNNFNIDEIIQHGHYFGVIAHMFQQVLYLRILAYVFLLLDCLYKSENYAIGYYAKAYKR